jgi:hypothetical protein
MNLARHDSRRWSLFLLVFAGLAFSAATAQAQFAAEPAMSPAEKKLADLLDKTSNVVAKKQFNEDAQRWEWITYYSIGDESTQMLVYLRPRLEFKDGTKLYAITAFAVVARMPSGQTFPDAVIKEVALFNANVFTGSVAADDSIVLVNTATYLDEATPQTLFLHFTDLHTYRSIMKEKVTAIVSGAAAKP